MNTQHLSLHPPHTHPSSQNASTASKCVNFWNLILKILPTNSLVLENCRGFTTVCKLENLCPKKAPTCPTPSDVSSPFPPHLCLHPHPPEDNSLGQVTHDLASTDYTLDEKLTNPTCQFLIIIRVKPQ